MSTVARLWFLLVIVCFPAHLEAQQPQAVPGRPLLSAGTFVGIGSGPSGSAVWGIEGTIPFSRFLAMRAEYSSWNSGMNGVCPQRWPDSYACSVAGWAGLAGIRAMLPLTRRVTPFVDLSGGRFTRDQSAAASHSSTAVSAGLGAAVRLYGGLSARLRGSVLHPFDDEYEALMGEKLHYTTGSVGLEYRITR